MIHAWRPARQAVEEVDGAEDGLLEMIFTKLGVADRAEAAAAAVQRDFVE